MRHRHKGMLLLALLLALPQGAEAHETPDLTRRVRWEHWDLDD